MTDLEEMLERWRGLLAEARRLRTHAQQVREALQGYDMDRVGTAIARALQEPRKHHPDVLVPMAHAFMDACFEAICRLEASILTKLFRRSTDEIHRRARTGAAPCGPGRGASHACAVPTQESGIGGNRQYNERADREPAGSRGTLPGDHHGDGGRSVHGCRTDEQGSGG